MANNLPANAGDAEDMGSIPGWEDLLEEKMVIHSSTPAGKISWTKAPGWVQPMGSQSQTRLGMHAKNWALSTCL